MRLGIPRSVTFSSHNLNAGSHIESRIYHSGITVECGHLERYGDAAVFL